MRPAQSQVAIQLRQFTDLVFEGVWLRSVVAIVFQLATVSASVVGCNVVPGKSHYVLAERLFSDQKYQASIEEFKKIVETDPRGTLAQQAMFRMASIQYLYTGEYREAIRNFRQFSVLSSNPELVYQAERSIGEILFSKLEDYKAAIEQYKKIGAKYPKSEDRELFQVRIAKAYYGDLNFNLAIETFAEFLKAYPQSLHVPEVLYQIGNTYFTIGKLDEAISHFNKVIERFPATPEAVFAQYGIGNCFEERRMYPEAISAYEKALEKHPARPMVEAKIRNLRQKDQKGAPHKNLEHG